MIEGKIKPVDKNVSSSKCDSTTYLQTIISASLSKVFEYCLTPNLTKHLPNHLNKIGSRNGLSCLSAVTNLRETIFVTLVKDPKFIELWLM